MNKDVRLSSTIIGVGEPLIVLHGLLGSGRNWQGIAQQMQDLGQFHLLDLRNHGASPWTEEMDYQSMAEDILHYMDDHQLHQAVIIGHSMGGKAAMAFSLQYPERVEKLIIVDIAPVTYQPSFRKYIQAMAELDLSTIERRAQADALLSDRVPDKNVRLFLLQNLIPEYDKLRWRVNLPVLHKAMDKIGSFPSFHQAYTGPTLFIYGDRSDYIKPEYHSVIFSLFPRARFIEIPGAGHWVHVDQPAAFIEATRSFVHE